VECAALIHKWQVRDTTLDSLAALEFLNHLGWSRTRIATLQVVRSNQFTAYGIGSLNLEECHSYKIDYMEFRNGRLSACKLLITLVGAARFELTTPCAQGSFRYLGEGACFQILTFQADAGGLLRIVEL
jgi:hypothetical protein